MLRATIPLALLLSGALVSLSAQQLDSARARYVADSIAHFQQVEADLTVLRQPPPPVAPGGPFGLTFGMPLRELVRLTGANAVEGNPGVFTAERVPTPHSMFESYVFVVDGEMGLCSVNGIGRTIKSGSNGAELRSAFAQLAESLADKYGQPKHYDHLDAGSIWDEPSDWMMGLLQKERTLVSYWLTDISSAKLPGWASGISLDTKALSGSTGYLSLRYQGRQFAECADRVNAQEQDAL